MPGEKIQGEEGVLMPVYGSISDVSSFSKRIGEILYSRGKITKEHLEEALRIQAQNGGRLGWILMSYGWISRLDLFEALAEHFGIEFWNLDFEVFDKIVDRKLLKQFGVDHAIEFHIIPLRLSNNTLYLLTDYLNIPRFKEMAKRKFGVDEIHVRLITDLDFLHLAQHIFGTVLIDKSVNGLFFKNPIGSAYPVFTRPQVLFLGLFMYTGLIWFYLDSRSFLLVTFMIIQLIFFLSISFKLMLSLAGAYDEMFVPISDQEVNELSDKNLMTYTVLVPVYKEPEVIHLLIDSLKKMDYPQNRLDIILLLEENDKETFAAAKAAKPPGNWRFIIVPDALPKTKPKACNYGVFFSRGEFLTIYDAEDIPDPDQLKKAVIGFKKYGPSYICLQAALNYFNANENIITKLFTLEYSYWFDYLLPGLNKFRLPIPLGGTSNHFRTKYLKELGAWDPFNVTEDADLGIRACAHGYRVGIINSTTYEEANSRYGNWLRQRSRWIKGYMQTLLVYNRHPLKMLRDVGLKNWLSFQLFIGGTPAVFLLTPLVWSIFLYWILTQTKVFDQFFPPIIVHIGLFNLLAGNFMGIYLNMIAVFRRKLFPLLPVAILNPIYWLFFHSLAAYKALWQLFFRPFYWEKTTHGISSIKN